MAEIENTKALASFKDVELCDFHPVRAAEGYIDFSECELLFPGDSVMLNGVILTFEYIPYTEKACQEDPYLLTAVPLQPTVAESLQTLLTHIHRMAFHPSCAEDIGLADYRLDDTTLHITHKTAGIAGNNFCFGYNLPSGLCGARLDDYYPSMTGIGCLQGGTSEIVTCLPLSPENFDG